MKKGFTLAEILITLGVIGIVAAMTIPGLITKYQQKQTVIQLKKVFNRESAWLLMIMGIVKAGITHYRKLIL